MSSYSIFHILHLVFLFLLTGVTFAAFAAPDPEKRKRTLMLSGIYSLAVFLTGFGLLGILKLGFPSWILVKIVCWFILSALAGMAFRMPGRIKFLNILAITVIVIAVFMVETGLVR